MTPGPTSDTYDVIVVGAGAGGMTAALVAAEQGLKVLLLEKTGFIGGTTAWSGGMVWIPGNHHMAAKAAADLDGARVYLENTVPEAAGASMREAFLRHGHEAIAYLEARSEVKLQPVRLYPDYYPELPGSTAGGRVLEPVVFDGSALGPHFKRLRPPLPEFTLLGGMMVNRADIPHLRKIGVSWSSTLRSMRLVADYLRQRLRAPRGTTLHLGNALAGRLYASLLVRKVEMVFGAAADQLLVDHGRVGGIRVAERPILSRRGVVLATGGFSHDAELRERFFPRAAGRVSATSPAVAGDGIRLALQAGAELSGVEADPAYWVPASLFKRADGSAGVFPHTVTDRAKPGVIAVNPAGHRFVNEALSYHEFVRAMLRDGNDGAERFFYLICDSNFVWNYGLGRIRPFSRSVRRHVENDELAMAASIADLAEAIGVDRQALTATVEHYNAAAHEGRDPAFGRGGTIYQRFLGDAGRNPNPCIAPIVRGPFYALRIVPADLGTAVGLRTDADARVLQPDGTPIPGLYACGNDMNSIMNGNYPGPGITLGPALTFGYLAAKHLARAQSAGQTSGGHAA